ncbi:MAG TPA: adenylosuccinate lyase [Bacteroidales bacterium]|nr:adenylosuccinate lyase [Bacteroidales bacterium]HPS18349.1 adenylosuccinate lyase [Bacteroidales bacterium]
MKLEELTAISPVDGRYRKHTESLANYFSEFALIRYRVFVEVEYFISLCEIPLPQLKSFKKEDFKKLRKITESFSIADANKIKDFEKITNHDVKAVEYFLKEAFKKLKLEKYSEFIHFGLTSQDINNTAVPLSLKECFERFITPLFDTIVHKLDALANEWKNIPMLAHTHGQPASPTRLGKEIKVFSERLKIQLKQLSAIPFSAKFGGATGNFNAHHAAYPEINWVNFANMFVNEKLLLSRSQTTTQIEHYDNFAAFCDNLKRINTILIDLDRDMWTYISMKYFNQRIKKGEVGSSAMPHKVNPIDFENSEGNLGVANALLEHLSAKLPVSRLQRDLTDSTVLRNIGVPIAHSVIAYNSLLKGLDKLLVNEEAIKNALEENWAVVAEGIQTILRREGYPKPYEALKDLTRNNEKITKENIHKFIDTLKVSDKIKKELKKLTPFNYTGV